jgi:hypothetical protein
MLSTNFHGLKIDDRLNWKNHIAQMVPKLSGACYAVGLLFQVGAPSWGVFFWGGAESVCIIHV